MRTAGGAHSAALLSPLSPVQLNECGLSRAAALQFVKEPGPSMRPVIVRGSRGNAESLGRLLEGQADEIAELDEVGLKLAPGRELVEGVIDGEQLIVLNGGNKF